MWLADVVLQSCGASLRSVPAAGSSPVAAMDYAPVCFATKQTLNPKQLCDTACLHSHVEPQHTIVLTARKMADLL